MRYRPGNFFKHKYSWNSNMFSENNCFSHLLFLRANQTKANGKWVFLILRLVHSDYHLCSTSTFIQLLKNLALIKG